MEVVDTARKDGTHITATLEKLGIASSTYYDWIKRPGIRNAVQQALQAVATEIVATTVGAMGDVIAQQISIALGRDQKTKSADTTRAAALLIKLIGLDRPHDMVQPEHWSAARFFERAAQVVNVQQNVLVFAHEGQPPRSEEEQELLTPPDLVIEGEIIQTPPPEMEPEGAKPTDAALRPSRTPRQD
jgi:LAS superfamily LD-carboxypeptidase LdcB